MTKNMAYKIVVDSGHGGERSGCSLSGQAGKGRYVTLEVHLSFEKARLQIYFISIQSKTESVSERH